MYILTENTMVSEICLGHLDIVSERKRRSKITGVTACYFRYEEKVLYNGFIFFIEYDDEKRVV